MFRFTHISAVTLNLEHSVSIAKVTLAGFTSQYTLRHFLLNMSPLEHYFHINFSPNKMVEP